MNKPRRPTMPRYPKPSPMSLTPLAPMPPTDETYSLSTHIHHTFTLTETGWRQLALARHAPALRGPPTPH